MMVGDGLPCGFACAKSSRTSLCDVEPDGATPRHFMPFTAFAVISRNPLKIKKSTSLEVLIIFKWWWEMDSNHRRQCQQIYSLPPLATRESHQNGAGKGGRTPLTSLEGWCTADMPYPHYRLKVFLYHFRKNGTDEGSRTLKPCGTRT